MTWPMTSHRLGSMLSIQYEWNTLTQPLWLSPLTPHLVEALGLCGELLNQSKQHWGWGPYGGHRQGSQSVDVSLVVSLWEVHLTQSLVDHDGRREDCVSQILFAEDFHRDRPFIDSVEGLIQSVIQRETNYSALRSITEAIGLDDEALYVEFCIQHGIHRYKDYIRVVLGAEPSVSGRLQKQASKIGYEAGANRAELPRLVFQSLKESLLGDNTGGNSSPYKH